MDSYKQIIKGVKQNNFRLQMQFYDMFAFTTYRSAFAVMENSSDAEEIMQDTMLKVFARTSLINSEETQMRKTLRRIAINAAIDELRKRKNSFVFDNIENCADSIDETESDIDENNFTVEKIKQVIDSLAFGYRTIVTLHLLENISFDEISEQLNISPNTVRSQYSRALAKLRNYLKSTNIK